MSKPAVHGDTGERRHPCGIHLTRSNFTEASVHGMGLETRLWCRAWGKRTENLDGRKTNTYIKKPYLLALA